ncbi:hypothetical protein [Chromobacterium sp. LK11]|uniref:hypothetical protein n=1 Tax=Chromobacterium sp. LK11 TaxID=1628212 RepID=UPI0012E32161|nr:hypothetical protein [Chromobacterium sp. LK11]
MTFWNHSRAAIRNDWALIGKFLIGYCFREKCQLFLTPNIGFKNDCIYEFILEGVGLGGNWRRQLSAGLRCGLNVPRVLNGEESDVFAEIEVYGFGLFEWR